MSQLFILNMELDSIRSFLERVVKSVDSDYIEITHRAGIGEFADEDDESNAFFDPEMSEEIAIRATLGELNALVEWELQHIASEPFAQEQIAKRTKHNKIIWDLKRDDLYRLIEEYYSISVDDLPGSKEVEEIRRTINAYKHRKGFKDSRKDTDWIYFLEKYEVEREKAFSYIEAVRDFLQALWAKTVEQQTRRIE
jgi:hypothetical protein